MRHHSPDDQDDHDEHGDHEVHEHRNARDGHPWWQVEQYSRNMVDNNIMVATSDRKNNDTCKYDIILNMYLNTD